MHLLDYLQLEELASVCEEASCWSFLCVIAHCGFRAVPAHRSTPSRLPDRDAWSTSRALAASASKNEIAETLALVASRRQHQRAPGRTSERSELGFFAWALRRQ